MDRLTSLDVFVRVVETGGFSAAARRLNMSTTMVSNHVQALEDRLGVRLLQRTTRKVSLTEIGKAYYDRSHPDTRRSRTGRRHRRRAAIDAARHATDPHRHPHGAVRRARDGEFLSTYPEVKVDLRMGEADIDLIEEGYDVALRMIAPPDSSLIVRSLATWRHVLCCSHDYIEAHGRVQTLEELAGHNCVRHINYPFDDDGASSIARARRHRCASPAT